MIKIVKFTPNQENLISGGLGNIIKLWDLEKLKIKLDLKDDFNQVTDLDISIDKNIMVSCGN